MQKTTHIPHTQYPHSKNMQKTMQDHAAVYRTQDSLAEGVVKIDQVGVCVCAVMVVLPVLPPLPSLEHTHTNLNTQHIHP